MRLYLGPKEKGIFFKLRGDIFSIIVDLAEIRWKTPIHENEDLEEPLK